MILEFCDTIRSNSFLFVLVPLRRSLCLFWRETHTKNWGQDLPRDRKWRRKEGPREDRESSWQSREEETSRREIAVQRMSQQKEAGKDGSRAEKRVNRSQKGDCLDLLTYRGQVNLREKMSALLSAFVEVSCKIHARDSLQMHRECTVSPTPFLALGADPSPCLFVCSFFPPSRLCFAYL